MLATGGGDKVVKLWDRYTHRQIAALKGHVSWIEALAFSPDGRTLASASGDCTAKLWNLATGQEVATLAGHRRPIFSLAFSPDGSLLATGSEDGTVRFWRATSVAETDAPTRAPAHRASPRGDE
jgi:WD40 repeat protein